MGEERVEIAVLSVEQLFVVAVEGVGIVRHMCFNVGSAIKYMWRAGLKPGEASVKDLKKAIWYINDEIARLEKKL
jgi:hypothetical protein